MAGVARKPNEKIKYMYKLNENCNDMDSRICVNGITLNKGSWTSFEKSKNKELRAYIKSFENPKGIVDEYVHDPLVELYIKENSDDIKFVHRKKVYSREVLTTFSRKELEEIAKEYLINPKEKVNNFLINCIITEQTKYRKSLVNTNDFFNETNKIEKNE
jgi:hypothetical protein